METAARLELENQTFIVHSPIMQKLLAMVERVARHPASVVLIVGETGSGKEFIARAVHRHSLRSSKPFVDVNCAALPEHLIESELFGYEKGAFSGAESAKPGLFELANGGTILLDEIGELHSKVQAKLLRVLDGISYFRLGGSRKIAVDLRVIAATNRNLEEEVQNGQFRRDLYHRLTNVQLHVPPLRERPEDITALAEHFLGLHCPTARFTRGALEMLQTYPWPGNVRELQNVIFKMALNAKPGAAQIDAHDLPPEICGTSESSPSSHALEGSLDDMEKRMILQALERNGGNQSEAARQLGISSRTLRRKLEKYRSRGGERYKGAPLATLSELQQRYYRVNLETPVLVTDSRGSQSRATSVNVSCGGIAVRCSVQLEQDAVFEVAFSLPGIDVHFEAKAKLAWTSPGGSAGLSFVDLHPVLEHQLRRWVLERAQEDGWSPADSVSD